VVLEQILVKAGSKIYLMELLKKRRRKNQALASQTLSQALSQLSSQLSNQLSLQSLSLMIKLKQSLTV